MVSAGGRSETPRQQNSSNADSRNEPKKSLLIPCCFCEFSEKEPCVREKFANFGQNSTILRSNFKHCLYFSLFLFRQRGVSDPCDIKSWSAPTSISKVAPTSVVRRPELPPTASAYPPA